MCVISLKIQMCIMPLSRINILHKVNCFLQLATKEKEIIRLRNMLEGGRSYVAVSKDCACKKMEKKAGVFQDVMEINEMRILQQAKLELEQQLKGKNFHKIERFYSKRRCTV